MAEDRFVWSEGVLARGAAAAECPKCGGFCPLMKEVPSDIASAAATRDCGRRRMCCTAAFQCKRCQQIVLAQLEAPELE